MVEHIIKPIGPIEHSIFFMFLCCYKRNCKGNFIQIHHPTGPTVQSYWHHGKWTDVFNSSKLNINIYENFTHYSIDYIIV